MGTTTILSDIATSPSALDVLLNLELFGAYLGFPSGDLGVIFARIARALFGLLGIIFLILVIWSGFTIMISGGNEERVTQAKRTFVNAVIGLVIILTSYSIVTYIVRLLLP